MATPDSVVQALIIVRRQQGLSQREVTRALGTSSATMSMWERGLSSPTLDHLRAWAKVLGYELTITPGGGS